MFKVGLLLAVSAGAENPFTDSAKFERWSHFKDYGVPAVMGKDALNSAAIADGSCRFVEQNDGFDFWHYPSRVERVLQALKDAPPTSNPSHFVLSAETALREACSDKGDKNARPGYTLDSMAGSVQNWYHALTAPASDPSWKGAYDPAYQPQQVAITIGLMCITACDLNDGQLSKSAMRKLSNESSMAHKAIEGIFPWVTSPYGNTLFSGAKSVKELAKSLEPMLEFPCRCSTKPSQASVPSSRRFCPTSLQFVYADMHDGDKKEVTISGTSMTIKPSGNNQTWVVKSEVDPMSCSASINFNVSGKPGPPPVNLQAKFWQSVSSKGKKTLFEFTDPSGTLADKSFPLNLWVEEVKKEDAMAFHCPQKLHVIYADMHDGDKKEVVITGTSMTITPSGNKQTWVVKSQVDSKTCAASIDFNVPGKTGPPPVNLQATLVSITSARSGKTGLEFTDPSGTLASPAQPLNHWVEISRKTLGNEIVI